VTFRDPSGLPLVRFLLPRTQLRRVPCSVASFLSVARAGRGSPNPRQFRPQGSCPSRRFRLSTRLAPHAPRRLAGLFHPARVPGAPLQSFPFPGSRTRSRGPLLPCGFASDCRRREARGRFTIAFPCRASSFAARARLATDPGRMSRDEGFLRSLGRPPRHTRRCTARIRPLPRTSGSPVNGRHAHFEALLPPGVRSDDDLALARLGPPRRCSPGVLHPPECAPPRFRVRSLADPHAGGSRPSSTHVSGCPVIAVAFPRPELRPLSS